MLSTSFNFLKEQISQKQSVLLQGRSTRNELILTDNVRRRVTMAGSKTLSIFLMVQDLSL